MSWALRIARVSGIDIKIHITFLLILLHGGMQWGSHHGTAGFVFGVLLMLALFTCVTLHELGHSLAAQYFKIPVREIVLLPIGGVALLGKLPEKPRQELIIAAAGPAVNVVIAAVLALVGAPVLATLDGRGLLEGAVPTPSPTTSLFWLLAANISLVAFNLIPAFPLDGGRMLRAVLAMIIDYARATRHAAPIGQAAAVLLGILGAAEPDRALGRACGLFLPPHALAPRLRRSRPVGSGGRRSGAGGAGAREAAGPAVAEGAGVRPGDGEDRRGRLPGHDGAAAGAGDRPDAAA